MSEPKVTECWTVGRLGQDNPDAQRATHYKTRFDRPAILLWREDYDALRKELEELREWKEEMCT